VGGLYGLSDSAIDERAAALLRLLDLSDKADDEIRGYSHGMRQKIVLCTALLHEPRVLLLDEPLSGLDPHSARRVKETLREFCRRGGRCCSPPIRWKWPNGCATGWASFTRAG
jgi:ABC-2 type transport system ATP-binding protein